MEDTHGDEHDIDFDDSFLLKTTPALGAAEDFNLSAEQVKKIFGINECNFTSIPSRLVVPILNGRQRQEGWYQTSGWLYVLEPQEWVPVVRHGDTVVASAFKTPCSTKRRDVSEDKFNAGCKASIALQAGGSYYGVSVGVKGSANIAFKYSSTSMREEDIGRSGIDGGELVQELVLYPILRCKAIQRQRIDYTINGSSDELEWGKKSSDSGRKKRARVPSSRLGSIDKMQFHPVPVEGRGLEDQAYLLPVPHIDSNGKFKVTTLLRRTGWSDWYVYDSEFQDCSKTIDLAASQNDVAFRPTSCWTTLSDNEPASPSETDDSSRGSRLDGSLEHDSETSGDEGNPPVVECALEPLDK